MMKSLPSNVVGYKRTDIFDEVSVPKALLNEHRTLPNVWGKIVVIEGNLTYIIGEEEYELANGKPGVVEPQVIHKVRPEGKVRFYVEFYK